MVSGASGASFQVEGSVQSHQARRMISAGNMIDPISRTIPVLYEVSNPSSAIKIGATARVAVKTGRRAEGVLIPSSAVLDEDGRAIAYVQVSGERFEKRELMIVGTGGGRTVVSSGIKAGERVVTGAAYQVRLASLSTAVPAHGHEH
jgi:membrane fusion protein, heavy metal efflux system